MSKLSPLLNRPLRSIWQLIRDRRGATAIMLAIALSGIIGFAGLGSEVASWYFTTRAMQGAASSSASSAAAELASAILSGSTWSNDQLTHTGRAVSATFNFTNGVSSTTVSVNHPPTTTTGLDTSRCDARLTTSSQYGCYVEVVIQQPQPLLLSSLFMSTGPTITSRAVALANTGTGSTGCVLALDGVADRAANSGGSGTLTFNNCAIYSNSNSSSGIYVGGSGTVNAQAAYVVGQINGTVNTTQGSYTGVNPAVDPYANVPAPSGWTTTGSCGTGGTNGQGLDKLFPNNQNTVTINPAGCSLYGLGGNKDLHLTNSQTLNLCPGIYVFDSTSLIMDGQSTLNAPPTTNISTLCPGNTSGGVTIIFSNSGGGNPGIPNIAAGANVTLTAPTSGTYSGIAMMGDRLTCAGSGNNNNGCNPSITGGGTQNITGAIYFPRSAVSYAGGSSTGGSNCTQLIADTITFTGGSTFNSSCASAGTQTINSSNGTLVM